RGTSRGLRGQKRPSAPPVPMAARIIIRIAAFAFLSACAPAAERCYCQEIAATTSPVGLRGSTLRLPAVTIMVSLHRSSPEPLRSALAGTDIHAPFANVSFTRKCGHLKRRAIHHRKLPGLLR